MDELQKKNQNAKKLDLALQMYDTNRYEMAKPLFEELSKDGNILSTKILGMYYHYGLDGNTDYKKALAYYRKVIAENEITDVWFDLGRMYEDGLGVRKNYRKAKECFEKAVENGCVSGYVFLGKLYLFGEGVKRDEKKCYEYFLRAAEGGDVFAAYRVGCCYLNGTGVEKDINLAEEWLCSAADDGEYFDACTKLSDLYLDKKSSKYNPKLALYYAKRALELDPIEGEAFLSMFYAVGNAVEKNTEKFLEMVTRAIDNGSVNAAYLLGKSYMLGNFDLPEDMDRAEKYLTIASEREVGGMSDYYLGVLYGDTIYKRIDYRKARFYLERFINTSSSDKGFFEIGWLYYFGKGIKKNLQKAYEYFKKGTKRGCPDCMAMYANFYDGEKGFPEKPHLTYKWYKKSMDLGSAWGYLGVLTCYALGVGVKQNLKKAREMGDYAVKNDMWDKEIVDDLYRKGERKAMRKKKTTIGKL